MSRPTHKAYVVQEAKKPDENGEQRKGRWLEVGAVWPHRNGSGFDVVIAEGIALTGRIVCVPPKVEDEKPPAD